MNSWYDLFFTFFLGKIQLKMVDSDLFIFNRVFQILFDKYNSCLAMVRLRWPCKQICINMCSYYRVLFKLEFYPYFILSFVKGFFSFVLINKKNYEDHITFHCKVRSNLSNAQLIEAYTVSDYIFLIGLINKKYRKYSQIRCFAGKTNPHFESWKWVEILDPRIRQDRRTACKFASNLCTIPEPCSVMYFAE